MASLKKHIKAAVHLMLQCIEAFFFSFLSMKKEEEKERFEAFVTSNGPQFKKVTKDIKHYVIPQSHLPPSSPIKSYLFFDETYDDYRFESTRLESFKNWPWISGLWIKPEKLAAAGFYYTGDRDKIQCFECPIEIYGKWQVDDNPMAYHQRAYFGVKS